MTQGIYRIRHLGTDAAYIGSTGHFRKRWTLHRCDLRRGRHSSVKLQRLWNVYGSVHFVFEVLERIDRRSELITAEQRYMDAELVLLNKSKRAGAGSVMGRNFSSKTRHKISAANKGRKHTAESRVNMSLAHKGQIPTAEHREKQSIAMKGFIPVNRRNRTHCVYGHLLPSERRANGNRKNCRECNARRQRERTQRRKAVQCSSLY